MTQTLGERLRAALRLAGLHLLLSALLAAGVAIVVFRLWFPAPLDELIHGRQLFLLITVVDVVCGPLLTLVLFNPLKSRDKWRIDIALIVVVQCLALIYGLWQLSASRAVLLALEGDRFRVVQAADVDSSALLSAPETLRVLSWSGPQLVGVHLLQPTDPGFAQSIQLATQGEHPAFRPTRWEPYDDAWKRLSTAVRPLSELASRYPERREELDAITRKTGLSEEALGFLPLVSGTNTDWVIVLRRQDGQPVGHLHMDAW